MNWLGKMTITNLLSQWTTNEIEMQNIHHFVHEKIKAWFRFMNWRSACQLLVLINLLLSLR